MNDDLQMLSLLCPQWRGPMMVLNAATRQVEYANELCTDFLETQRAVRFENSTFSFLSATAQHNLDEALRGFYDGADDTAVVLVQDPESDAIVTCVLRYPIGYAQNKNGDLPFKNLSAEDVVIVEWLTGEFRPDPACLDALAKLWALLPSERKDLVHLSAGHTAEAIAKANDCSLATVRQRIKSILAKSNCPRQQELIAKVRDYCPAKRDFRGHAVT
jgi:DNA-binding CsgD family transcriptional regulator